jgi:hypothetical protein
VQERLQAAKGAEGFCCNLGLCNADVLVWVQKRLCKTSSAAEFGVLYHELMHAVDRICARKGIDDTETRAYLFEFLANECHKVLWNV